VDRYGLHVRLRLLVATSLALASVVLVVRPSAAQPTKPGDDYVALGHSFASGAAIPPIVDESCSRSGNNYAHLVARTLKLTLTDVTCAGATTDDITFASQGVHPPQADALTLDTRLVTVTIGSNDVGYTVANIACSAAGKDGTGCLGTSLHPEEMDAALAALPGKMAVMFTAIKARAPGARVVLVPDLRVLPPAAMPCPPSVPMQPADLRFLVDAGDKLHTIMEQSAKAAHVDYVETYTPRRHHACVAPAKRWIEGQEPESPAAVFHPNEAGMKALASSIVRDLQRRS
jgi:lysophospholipase L1-like esterase